MGDVVLYNRSTLQHNYSLDEYYGGNGSEKEAQYIHYSRVVCIRKENKMSVNDFSKTSHRNWMEKDFSTDKLCSQLREKYCW